MSTSESSFLPEGKNKVSPRTQESVVAPHRLRRNVLSLPGVLFLCVAAIAPAASMIFNVPVMASQAGASTPFVFLLATVGVLLLGVSVASFARRLSSAAGFSTWVRHGLGERAAFLAGWLMLGAYALFEAALQATVGGSLDNGLAGAGVHLVGGWMTYAVLLTLIVGTLSYFALTVSLWVMAPFAILEVLALVILDLAISLRGGAAGHDLLHTFLPLGTTVQGVAPGGSLGIGVAMVLGVLAFVGFETGAVYGEEAREPKRTIPRAMVILILGLAVLYTWTAYATTIGVGWTQAGTVLGNVNTVPQQYLHLATTFVGSWLGIALLIFVITSNFASAFAMHQAQVRYVFDMGRARIFPGFLGQTHPRWKSPAHASVLQTAFSLLVIGFLGLILSHTNPDGRTIYTLGVATGGYWQQVNGTVSFGWLASIVTMCILIVYLLTNVAAFFFARRNREMHVWRHLIAPAGSSLFLLLPLLAYVGPALPGVGSFFTQLGFAPTPFPSNILPLFVLGWIGVGWLYSVYLSRRFPERFARMGSIITGT
jgi:amino acid transporter